jgi:hypothetical protein
MYAVSLLEFRGKVGMLMRSEGLGWLLEGSAGIDALMFFVYADVFESP